MCGLGQVSEIPPFTLQLFIQIVVERWRVILAFAGVCFVLGVIYLHMAAPTYTVEMQVAPIAGEASTQSSLATSSPLLSQFAGRAGGQQNNFDLYLAGLQSIETARVLAQNPAFMHRMFASEWSVSDQAWVRPHSMLGAVSRAVKGVLGLYVAPWAPPDAVRVNEFLQGNIGISRSLVSPVVTVSMQTTDRQFGLAFIAALHEAVDGILRRRTLARVSGYVGYLNGLIEKATIVEYRSALADTIMQQERTRMVAASGAPYAADLFSRPSASRLPTGPKGTMVLLESIFLGLLLGVVEAVLRERLGIYRRFLVAVTRWRGKKSVMAGRRPAAE